MTSSSSSSGGGGGGGGNPEGNRPSSKSRRSNSGPSRGDKSRSTSDPSTASSSASDDFESTAASRQIAGLRTQTISHPTQQVALTCYIPPSRVGAVIGRRGASILNIQREAAKRSLGHSGQVRVSVVGTNSDKSQSQGSGGGGASGSGASPPEQATAAESNPVLNQHTLVPPDLTDPHWTPVLIRADPVGAIAAARLLLPLVDREMDDVVLDVPIHRSRHAVIIGRKGLTIAGLSADSGVRIMVPNRRAEAAAGDQMLFPQQDGGGGGGSQPSPASRQTSRREREAQNVVQLEGELDAVEQCLARMLSVVAGGSPRSGPEKPPEAEHTQAQQPSGRGGKNEKNKEPNEAVVTAPPEVAHLVPSLTKLRTMGKQTGTVIRRKRLQSKSSEGDEEMETADVRQGGQQQGGENVTTQLIVTGKADAVKGCVSMLERILTLNPAEDGIGEEEPPPAREQQHSGGGGGGKRRGKSRGGGKGGQEGGKSGGGGKKRGGGGGGGGGGTSAS